MPTPEELAQQFRAPDGFKKYIGFLGGRLAKRCQDALASSDENGVCRSYTLDSRTHDGGYYYINAIGTRGDLDEHTVSELTREATLIPLGAVRWESSMAPQLPNAIGSDDKAAAIHSLSRLSEGIIVYPKWFVSKAGTSTFAVWARTGDDYAVFPLEDKKL